MGYGIHRLPISATGTEVDVQDNLYGSGDLLREQRNYALSPLGYPDRPKKFESRKEKENYVAALNTYFMLFGRPRFVPTMGLTAA
ncbi:unnamed protein product [Schistocephalus solidus]|uniref:Uncharacterized protein n=1 Tax=Schistocephalus solidus TaxID=70667 RepID=A0A183S898_SCHSO|nr:unnamed protein product [Schistocephalus solidus]